MRRWGVRLPILLALAIVAWSAYWYVVARDLRARVATWQASLPAQGWQLEQTGMTLAGWPLRAGVTLSAVTLHRQGVPSSQEVSAAAPAITVAVDLPTVQALRISLPEPLHLRFGDRTEVTVAAESLAAETPLRPDAGSARLDGQAVRLRAADGSWQVTAQTLRASGVLGKRDATGASAVTVDLSSEALTLPPEMTRGLSTDIRSVAISGRINHWEPSAATPRQVAINWRDHGGTVDVTHYDVAWGPLQLSGSAALTLDDQLQPAGEATAHAIGYAPALDRLAHAGVITASAALTAKALLLLLSGGAASAGGPQPAQETDRDGAIDVPLTLRDRTLSLHQVPLIRLPALDWAGGP